ncbi:MAG: hypothetical protein HYR60_29385, partial [Acidobacteria bacterium]|nr:hypothetical protein [Acidobacteriota bacterium]
RTLAELAPGTRPLRWSADGVFLFVDRREGATARIYRVFLAEGRADQWTEISGIAPSSRLVMTPDGRSYAYSYSQNSRDLYVLEGLR